MCLIGWKGKWVQRPEKCITIEIQGLEGACLGAGDLNPPCFFSLPNVFFLLPGFLTDSRKWILVPVPLHQRHTGWRKVFRLHHWGLDGLNLSLQDFP